MIRFLAGKSTHSDLQGAGLEAEYAVGQAWISTGQDRLAASASMTSPI